MKHIIMAMASLKEYRFRRDAAREPAEADDGLLSPDVTAETGKGVVGAIARARAAGAVGGTSGKHRKILDKAGKVVDAEILFGRHKGALLSDLKRTEPTYIAWLLERAHDPLTRPDGFPADFIEIVRRFA